MIELFQFQFFDNRDNNHIDKSLIYYNPLICSSICSEQSSGSTVKKLLSLPLLFQEIFKIKGITAKTKKYTHIKIIYRITFALISAAHCVSTEWHHFTGNFEGKEMDPFSVLLKQLRQLQTLYNGESDSMNQCKIFLAYGIRNKFLTPNVWLCGEALNTGNSNG